MIRLKVVVEGPTEETFVKTVLVPHLENYGVFASASIVGKQIAHSRGHRIRGGGSFAHWRRDIERLLQEERSWESWVTTLLDLYGLPEDFPGLGPDSGGVISEADCHSLEAALGAVFEHPRFIPYLQRHEFEALVLGSLPHLEGLLDAVDDLAGLKALRAEIAGLPLEDINGGKETAPSKRLMKHIPSYHKVLYGPLCVHDEGLPSLRSRCPRFDAWLSRLEGLSPASPSD